MYSNIKAIGLTDFLTQEQFPPCPIYMYLPLKSKLYIVQYFVMYKNIQESEQ